MTGRLGFLAALAAATTVLLTGPAGAAAAPAWKVTSAADTNAAPGSTLTYYIEVGNAGTTATDGVTPYALTSTLPAGLSFSSANGGSWDCSASAGPNVSCIATEALKPQPTNPALEQRSTALGLTVEVDPGATGILTAEFSVAGGQDSSGEPASPASTADPTRIDAGAPGFGIDAFDGRITGEGGGPFTQAAGRPDQITTYIDLNRTTNPSIIKGPLFPIAPAKDILVAVPPGLIGNPTTVGASCNAVQLANSAATDSIPLCPSESQVGTVSVVFNHGIGAFSPRIDATPVPLFKLTPPGNVPARFGFNFIGTPVVIDAELRSGGDYGLSLNSKAIPEGVAFVGTAITFWGVPSDPSHDTERACPGRLPPWAINGTGDFCTSDAPRLAFLRLPTSCTKAGEGLPFSLRTDSWLQPGDFKEASFRTHEPLGYPFSPEDPATPWGAPVGTSGCDQVPFEPTIAVQATSDQADSPTGLNVDLTMPQSDDPEAISQSDLKTARTILPEGMTVNPAAANGLTGCSLADVGLHNAQPPSCPDASKIGTNEIVSPDLEEPLVGSIYQAKQGDDPSHSLLAFYTVAEGSGVRVKLAAHVERDPQTGQLTTVFDDNPQLPFDRYSLRFDSGPRAPLVNPPTCGTHTTNAIFTSYARPDEEVERQSSFQITSGPNGSPCPAKPLGFSPKLGGGTASPIAGAATPFLMRLTREDGEQRFSGLTVKPPAGLSAYLKGVPYCPESALAAVSSAPGTGAAQLANPSCPAASQVGTVSAGTGAGPLPFYVDTGKVYLAGPYKGASLSLAIVVPAVAGPLDLGSVLTRAAINIDPQSARLTVVSDPLPQLIEGIPLDVRDLRVNIDRDHFAVNPTSCEPMSIETALTGSEGAAAAPSQHFQLGECGALAFKPKLSLRLKGKTRRSGNPSLRATLTMPTKAKNANIARAAVTLPHSEFLDQSHIRTICTRVQFAAGNGGGEQCPKGSVYGHARAFTPLLDKPLEGPVYLRSSDHPLPDLVASLGGQIHIDLVGRIDSVNGGIRNTFELTPDAPVSKFVLTMQGGAKSLLENSTDLCRRAHRATALFDGQNGKVHDLRPVVKADCGKGRGQKHRR